MKNIIIKIWHGFLYGIGASLAWWFVFSILGYTLIDQFMPELLNNSTQTVSEGKVSPDAAIQKHLDSDGIKNLEIPDANLPKID